MLVHVGGSAYVGATGPADAGCFGCSLGGSAYLLRYDRELNESEDHDFDCATWMRGRVIDGVMSLSEGVTSDRSKPIGRSRKNAQRRTYALCGVSYVRRWRS